MPEETPIVETVESAETKQEHPGLSHLPEEDQKLIIALRQESADKRIKAKEALKELETLKEEKRLADEKKMEEDGKLKELLDAKVEELKQLSPLKEEHDSMKDYFTSKLEEKIKDLPEVQKELVMSNDKLNVAQKLDWTEKLLNEVNGLKPTPDSVRPGGDAPDENIDMKDYLGKENQHKLVNLSKTNRPLYDAIIKEKNKLNI